MTIPLFTVFTDDVCLFAYTYGTSNDSSLYMYVTTFYEFSLLVVYPSVFANINSDVNILVSLDL